MARRACWLIVMSATLMAGCLHVPVLWSPDGRWLAYTLAVRPDEQRLAPGWLFKTDRVPGAKRAAGDGEGRPTAVAYRLWATRPETGVSVLLEESRGPLTAPAWSPDGDALAFGRLVPGENGRSRLEIVVQSTPDQKRVIWKQEQGATNPRSADLPGLSLAWSPDGRFLAIPSLQHTLSMAIIRADNGRVLKVVEDAYLPSWSPDGTKLAFVRGVDSSSLHLLDTNFGAPRQLAEIGRAFQAPVWSRDRRSVMVLGQRRLPQFRKQGLHRMDLLRVPIEGGNVEVIAQAVDAQDRDSPAQAVSFGGDAELENVFYTVTAEGQPSELVWIHPRNRETYKRANPVDFEVRVSSLAVSPDGKTLAFRAGTPVDFAPLGLWDLKTLRPTPIVPDDAARVEWVTTLVDAARHLLATHLPEAVLEDDPPQKPGRGRNAPDPRPAPEPVQARKAPLNPIRRATLLPVPGELPPMSEPAMRLRRLGRIGRPLCDRPADAPPAEPAVFALLDEARVFFDYLRGDYEASLASLETLEARMTDRDSRLRLLSLRAQIFIGRGEHEQAEQTIAYLQSLERPGPWRYEVTPAGSALTREVAPGTDWPKYLGQRARKLRDPSGGGDGGGPNGPAPDEADPDAGRPFMRRRPEDPLDEPPPVRFGAAEIPDELEPNVPRRLAPIPPRVEPPRIELPPRPVAPPAPRF